MKYFSGKHIHCLFPSPSKRTRMLCYFFSFVCAELQPWATHSISFCQFLPQWQNKSGNTLPLPPLSQPREETPSVLALVHVLSLVNSDRSCWVCDCCFRSGGASVQWSLQCVMLVVQVVLLKCLVIRLQNLFPHLCHILNYIFFLPFRADVVTQLLWST